MKTELDFTKVPLDKWVDLYNSVNLQIDAPMYVVRSFKDVKKAAEVQIKEESDLNKEIVEALSAWRELEGEEAVKTYGKVLEGLEARKKLLGIQGKPVEQKPELLPAEEIIK